MNKLILKISALLAYVFSVGINYLAVSLPLAGRSTGQISDSYQNLFAPASYAFSIWGLIYTLLGIYVVYQLWRPDTLVAKINRLFIVNAILNASWIFAWHYDLIWLSLIIMFGLLVTLIKISNLFQNRKITQKEVWLVRLPFTVYFGWITVATIANATVFLVYLGWNGFGLPESFWTVIILLVGTLIGIWRLLRDRFIPYGLVLIWSYLAILVKHLVESGFAGKYPVVIWTTVVCLLAFITAIIWVSVKKTESEQ